MKQGLSGRSRSRSSSATGRTTPSASASSSPTRRCRSSTTPTRNRPREIRRAIPHLGGDRDAFPRRDGSSRPATASRRSRAPSSSRSCAQRAAGLGCEISLRARARRRRRRCPRPTWSSAATASTARCASASPRAFGRESSCGRCRFSWLGTDLPLDAFTFCFDETEHGLFQVHAYPFAPGARPGSSSRTEDDLARAPASTARREAETVAFCERLFAAILGGASPARQPLDLAPVPDRAAARAGATATSCSLGDAAHTAHFSIGSGTKLAMEDAIALVASLPRARHGRRPGASSRPTRAARRLDVAEAPARGADSVAPLVRELERYLVQEPLPFAFNLMTRSKRITYDNLRERDPPLVERVDREFRRAGSARLHVRSDEPGDGEPGTPPADLHAVPGAHRSSSRTASSSRRCASTRRSTASLDDWHLVHLGSRAVGGAGLVIAEMTDVSAEGRITPGCAGHLERRSSSPPGSGSSTSCTAHSAAKIGVQLAHAGRKGSVHHPWEGEDVPLRRRREPGRRSAPSADAVPARLAGAARDGPRRHGPRARRIRRATRLRRRRPASTGSSSTWRTATCCRASSRRSRTSATTTTAARSRTACASRSRSSTRCAPSGRQHLPISVRISATDWIDAEGRGTTAEESVAFARELKARRLRPDRRLVGGQLARVAARVRPHVPGAVRRPDPARGGRFR